MNHQQRTIQKARIVPGTMALTFAAVCSFFMPSTVLASFMYEFEFLGSTNNVVTGAFEVDTNTGVVDETNLIQISIVSTTGIGGSAPFSIPSNDVVSIPDFGFDADNNEIVSMAIDATNDFQCGTGANTLCDVQMQVTTTAPFDEEIEQQTVRAVPEPTTLALMGLGLAGIGYRRHRSKKAA